MSFGAETEQENFKTRLHKLFGHTVTVTGTFDTEPTGHTALSLDLGQLEPAGRRG